MDWLTQMLGFSNNAQGGGSSPFGALGSRLANGPFGVGQPQPAQQPGPPMNITPQTGAAAPTNPGVGLWGQGQQRTPGQNFALNQAMGLMQQPQMQAPQWMPWMQMGPR